jgi:uncharacterized protein (DUF2267 family)
VGQRACQGSLLERTERVPPPEVRSAHGADWLSQAEMADLSAQLPVLVRGIYFEGWNPSVHAHERKKRDFVLSVRDCFGYDEEIDFDVAINAAFKLLDRHISHGEIVQVRNSMKKSLRKLWPVD